MQVRIIAVPPGEAPEAVRRAWVGLVLPLAAEAPGPVESRSYGVLSGRPERGTLSRLWNRLIGRSDRNKQYPVPVDEAVAILALGSPEAAAWWQTITPHMFEPGQLFGFAAVVCEEIT